MFPTQLVPATWDRLVLTTIWSFPVVGIYVLFKHQRKWGILAPVMAPRMLCRVPGSETWCLQSNNLFLWGSRKIRDFSGILGTQTSINSKQNGPGWCGSVGGVLSHKPMGLADWCFSPSLSPSLPLSLKINNQTLKRKNPTNGVSWKSIQLPVL